MVGSFYAITGIREGRGPNGEVPVRMEVDDWWASRDPIHLNQHTLALVAWSKMYDMSPNDKLSYYQIAGKQISSYRKINGILTVTKESTISRSLRGMMPSLRTRTIACTVVPTSQHGTGRTMLF